jgi:HK97 family phage major capsid protein
MSKTELLQKKGQLCNEAQAIMDAAQSDGRDVLRKEEEEKFLAIHKDVDALTRQVELLTRQEEAMRSVSEPGQRQTSSLQPGDEQRLERMDSRLSKGNADRELAVRGWFLHGAKSKGGAPDHMRAAAQRIGMNLESSAMTIRLGREGLRATSHGPSGMRVGAEDLRLWQQYNIEERANFGPQSSTSAGGYTIQDEAMREIEVALLYFGGMRQVSTVIRTDTGGPLPIPTINDTTNVGHLVAEGTTVITTDVTFSQIVLDAFKYTSDKVLVSVELMQDNSVNLPSLLGRLLGERLGRAMNTAFTTGTGTGQPNGVVTAATFTQATTGNSTGVTYANLLNLYHSVDPSYRNASRFMMNDNTLMRIKLMTDSQGRPLWLPGLVDRAPDTIFGSPYTINQDMSSMTISGKSILFGDFSKYWIRDVREFTLLRLDERFAEFLQVCFLAFLRTDGDLINAGTNPIKGYQNST